MLLSYHLLKSQINFMRYNYYHFMDKETEFQRGKILVTKLVRGIARIQNACMSDSKAMALY